MADWRKCDRCRKVLPGEAFDDDSPTCRSCLTARVATAAPAKAGPVTRTRTAPRPAPRAEPAPAGPRAPLLGVAGSGDLEVRERRARRTALHELATLHPTDFEHLLAEARQAEGLRA